MKTMYVYMLQCSDDSYYIGVTNNLEKRFQEHEQGVNRNCYTFTRRPLQIVYYEMFNNPLNAIAFEKKLKGWSRKKKKALIDRDYEALPKLSINSKKAHAQSSTGSD
jgi:putative endonuclease